MTRLNLGLLSLGLCAAAGLHAAALELGRPLELAEPMSIAKLLAGPDQFVGKTVQVRGKITEVCRMMGCWMMLRDEAGLMVRVKVRDGDIVFPKDSPGRVALAEGIFERFELTEEQAIAAARHEAEEMGRKFDPEKIKGPRTVYQIQGAGARLLD